MTTDLTLADQGNQPTALDSQMRYASALAQSDLVPGPYRGRPANVLVAMSLGASMGLSPAESLYRINVIDGKPSASAELIASNVRRAGHRLRVEGDHQHARAIIWRGDDPDFPFEATWDLAKATRAGLTGKRNWTTHPGAMLKARAITEVARMACPEALYGVLYDPEEVGGPGTPTPAFQAVSGAPEASGGARWGTAPASRDVETVQGPSVSAETFREAATRGEEASTTPEPEGPPDRGGKAGPGREPQDGPPPPEPSTDPEEESRPGSTVDPPGPSGEGARARPSRGPDSLMSTSQRGALFAAFTAAGFTTDPRSKAGRTIRLNYVSGVLGRPVESTAMLTSAEASRVIADLNAQAPPLPLEVGDDQG